MKPTIYQIQIRVFIKEMMRFYNGNTNYGTKEMPYPADFFHELISSYATFYGPLRNILVFKDNSSYNWVLESFDGIPLEFSSHDDYSEMDMEMLTDDLNDVKWKELFTDVPEMQPNGTLKVRSKKINKNEFELNTSAKVSEGGCIKYSFLFEFKDKNGATKYGTIDPLGSTMPMPPYD